jgi:hypothetical protein
MTRDERDQQKGRVARQLDEARRNLLALEVRARELADIYTEVAKMLRTRPAEMHVAISANPNIPSPIAGVSAADLYNAVNVERLNVFAQDIARAQAEVREFTERSQMLN